MLYEALVEIIGDHMPEVFDEDLIDNDQFEKQIVSDNSRKKDRVSSGVTPDKGQHQRLKSEFSFANSAAKSSCSYKSGRISYESDKRHDGSKQLSKSFNTSMNLLDALDPETRKLVDDKVLVEIEELDALDENSRPVSPHG